jgi:hypothetical protein
VTARKRFVCDGKKMHVRSNTYKKAYEARSGRSAYADARGFNERKSAARTTSTHAKMASWADVGASTFKYICFLASLIDLILGAYRIMYKLVCRQRAAIEPRNHLESGRDVTPRLQLADLSRSASIPDVSGRKTILTCEEAAGLGAEDRLVLVVQFVFRPSTFFNEDLLLLPQDAQLLGPLLTVELGIIGTVTLEDVSFPHGQVPWMDGDTMIVLGSPLSHAIPVPLLLTQV